MPSHRLKPTERGHSYIMRLTFDEWCELPEYDASERLQTGECRSAMMLGRLIVMRGEGHARTRYPVVIISRATPT